MKSKVRMYLNFRTMFLSIHRDSGYVMNSMGLTLLMSRVAQIGSLGNLDQNVNFSVFLNEHYFKIDLWAFYCVVNMAYMQQRHLQQLSSRDIHITTCKILLKLFCIWTSYTFFTAFVASGKVWYPSIGLTTPVGWMLLLQLTVLSRSAIVV